MRRRAFLTITGASFLAGCSGGSDESAPDPTAEPTDTPTPTSTPTPTPDPGSKFRGPTREDRTYVDLQYRDYTDKERSTIRENAEAIEYDELYRNVENYVGEAVTYDGVVIQNLESEKYFIFLIVLNNDPNQLVYGSWTGGRFIEEDAVRIWAEVLGIEIYQTGAGSERSVPAVSIADMELLEEDEM